MQREKKHMSVSKKSGMAVVLVVVLALGALFAVPVAAQNNGLAGCDASTQALVWAAEDAYGYDWQAMMAAGFPNGAGGNMGGSMDQGSDATQEAGMDMNMDMTPEATQGAKLDNTAKVPSTASQDATQEPGDDMADATQEANAGNNNAGNNNAGGMALNCQQLQADVLAFVFAQNGMQMGGRGQQQMMFNVGGDEFVGEFFVQMSGPEEVPGPGDADGIGEGWLSLDNENNQLCWAITLSGIDFPATAAHIHIGEVGESGPPVIPMTPPADGNWAGCVEAEAQVIADIEANPPGFYVNVHTAPFPQGAVRGNLQGGGQQGQGNN